MISIIRKVIFISAAFLLAAAAFAQEITGRSGDFRTTITKEFKAEPGGKLVIKGSSGDIIVQSWDQNEVKIREDLVMDVYTREEAEEVVQRTSNSYSASGITIYIRGSDGRNEIRRSYQVSVPKKFNLDLNTSGGDISVQSVSGTVELNTSGGDVELMNIDGQTQVRTSGGDLVFKEISGPLQAHTSGGDVDMVNINGEASVNTSGGDISVVNAKNRVTVQTSGGDIGIERVDGDLIASTSGGDVSAAHCKGRIDLNTSGGDVEMIDMTGEASANTSGGDIVGQGFESKVDVRTSGGEISLHDVRAGASAHTSGGDVELVMTLADFKKPHPVNLETDGGSITLTLPAKLPATITAEIYLDRHGSFLKRFDIYSDFPLTKTEPAETDEDVLRSTGDINGGGDPITLRTRNGDIRIKKGF
jgi:hypothetical protein